MAKDDAIRTSKCFLNSSPNEALRPWKLRGATASDRSQSSQPVTPLLFECAVIEKGGSDCYKHVSSSGLPDRLPVQITNYTNTSCCSNTCIHSIHSQNVSSSSAIQHERRIQSLKQAIRRIHWRVICCMERSRRE
jgi:hypothetical protein